MASENAFAAAEALSVPWPIAVQRSLRTVLDDPGAADGAKVRSLIGFTAERGVSAAPAEAIQEITPADIHLVCYQVLSPKSD